MSNRLSRSWSGLLPAAAVVAVTLLALSACGAPGNAAAPPPSANPSSGPGMGFDVSVTEQTRTATVRVGQKIEAVLHARPGMTAWSGVMSSDTSVLAPIVDPAATAIRGVTLAAFQAHAPGKARITATAGADCSPGQACPLYAALLTIDITVIAG